MMRRIASIFLICILTFLPLMASCAETEGEKYALLSAQQYLLVIPMSYNKLIEQLEFDGYTTDEAIYAADNCNADWYEQAVKSGKNYLEILPLSRKALKEQLVFDEFEEDIAEYAVELIFNGDASSERASVPDSSLQIEAADIQGLFPVVKMIKESISKKEFDSVMAELGYAGTPSNVVTDMIVYENKDADPYKIMMGYDDAFRTTTGMAILYYQKNGSALSDLITYFSNQFGNPTTTPEKKSLSWQVGNKKYTITSVGTIENAKNGNEEYYVIVNNEDNNSSSHEQDSEKHDAKTLLDLFPGIKKGMVMEDFYSSFGEGFTEKYKSNDGEMTRISAEKEFAGEIITIDVQFKNEVVYSVNGTISQQNVEKVLPDYTEMYGKPVRTTILYAIGWSITGKLIEDKTGDVYAWVTKDYLLTIGIKSGIIEYTYLYL